MVTWRGFLARIGLAPLSDLRALQAYDMAVSKMVDRAVDETMRPLQAENAALRVENDNLKRAGRLRDEIPPMPTLFIDPRATKEEAERIRNTTYHFDRSESVVALHRLHSRLPNIADDPPPFGHTWLATGIAPVDERAQGFGSITAVDCLEGDKPRR